MASKLSKFAVDAPVSVENTEGSSPMTYDFTGKVLAFDQSLSNTGWAWLWFTGVEPPKVMDTGNITTEPIPGKKGYEETLLRTGYIFGEVLNILMDAEPKLVVHETPAIIGKAPSRNREAGIASATSVRCAVWSYSRNRAGKAYGAPHLVMLNAQHVKKVLTGDAKAEKKRVAEAVRYNTPSLFRGDGKTLRLNEHVYDALALGLVAASEERS